MCPECIALLFEFFCFLIFDLYFIWHNKYCCWCCCWSYRWHRKSWRNRRWTRHCCGCSHYYPSHYDSSLPAPVRRRSNQRRPTIWFRIPHRTNCRSCVPNVWKY